MKVVQSIAAALVIAMSMLALNACSVMRNPDLDPQAVVNRKVVGMKLGDFIDQFGGSRQRDEDADGSISFLWQSKLKQVAPGTTSPDDNLCRVRVIADRAGRIISAQIASDTTGERSTSECVDVFR